MVHLQRSEDKLVSGLVSLEESISDLHVSLKGASGEEVARYDLALASSPVEGEALQILTGETENPELSGIIPLTLTPVPGQRIIGPTAEDSVLFNIGDHEPNSIFFDFFNFQITILDITIVLPIINEVHLISFFDGGGSALDSPIQARFGELFRVRGVGVLVALRVEITIHISVVLIIGFVFEIWPFGLFNEFPEYGWAIGSVVIGILIQIDFFLNISYMTALVLPSGRLQVLAAVNLTIGIDFTISTDGRHLNFDPGFTHRVNFRTIHPTGNLFPCNGRFQLAEENGVSVFPDAYGGFQAFYFAHEQGRCCVPWSFDLDLVRFAPNGPEEMVQAPFEFEFCVRARQSPGLRRIIITSVPPPTGVPPHLDMDVGDSAVLKALAEPVDASGNPTGGPLQDVRDLGYGVEFYVDTPPDVLDPTLLPNGDAFAVLAGNNIIHAAITSIQIVNGPPEFTFWPGGVLGFAISRFLAEGELPRVEAGGLPVTVNEVVVITTIGITPLLVKVDNQGQPNNAGMEIERFEPFEIPRETYSLGVMLNIPANTPLPQTLTFRVTGVRLLAGGVQGPPLNIPGANFVGGRSTLQDPTRFFSGTLAQVNQQVSITINTRPDPNQINRIADLSISANQVEDAGLTKLVPPGNAVGNRDVVLSVDLSAQASNATVSMSSSRLDMKVVNSETFEEYLRVFREAQTILGQSGSTIASMRNMSAVLLDLMYNAAPNPADPAILMEQGNNLWELGWQLVQSGFTDDRPLYYARLQAIAAIRAYYRRTPLIASQVKTAVLQFEWPSRGLTSLTGTPGGRLAIVTGFDPFALTNAPKRSNPSGIIALKFKDHEFSSSQGPVKAATAILPVRYEDFDAGIIELALGPILGSLVMLITFSEDASRNFYDVERYATRVRGGAPDNNNKRVASGSVTPGTGTAEFLESTLPYERVITFDITTRKLKGPTLDETPFVLDQSYQLEISNGVPTPRVFVLSPSSNMGTDSYLKNTEGPLPNEPMRTGSGGSFLSNEIFYRTARKRNEVRSSLPSGHIHIPSTDDVPLTTGPKLLEGVEVAIQRFLQNSLLLRSSGDITFPPTIINITSQQVALTVTNDGPDDVLIATAQVTPPFAVQLPGALPLVVAPTASISLQCTFTPNAVRTFTGNLKLLGQSGEILVIAALSGEGIVSANSPRVTSFSPTSGRVGDTVAIVGEHLDGATSVEIGSGPVLFTVVSPTQIDAVVSAQATTGLIKVTTPNGTAFSTSSFTIIVGGDNASFIGQTPPPATMTALQSVPVSVTMHNNGITVWRAGIYKLGSQNPANNLNWGFNRVDLSADVLPGGNVTFDFSVTAPVLPGDYNFQWQMHSGSGFFGSASTNVAVTVNASQGAVPPAPTGLTATVASANQVDLHWNDVADNEGFAIERKSSGSIWTQIELVGSGTTSMSDQNLSAGTHIYRVRAFNASGYSSYSNIASATIGTASPPSAPVELTAIAGPGLQIVLGWIDMSYDEDGFSIERRTESTDYTQLVTVGPDVQFFIDKSVEASTTYSYQIKAFKGEVVSTPTNEARATTPGPRPPAAPGNLTATAMSITQVDLSWEDNSDNEDGFKIERKTESEDYVHLQTVEVNVTTFSDLTATGGTAYTYRVMSFNATGGDSDWSNEQQVITPTSTSPPTTPGTTTATAFSSTQINLEWSATSNNQAGFKIERKTSGGDFLEIASTLPSVISYSDTGLQPETAYTYRVKAYNDVGESEFSNEAKATTSAIQSGCQVSLVSGDGVYGYVEGPPEAARWRTPLSGVIAIDPASSQPALFIADTENHRIRMLLLAGPEAGQSVLIAGDGTAGFSDAGGNPLAARFNGPRGIAAFTDESGVVTSLIIADTNNHAIRKLLWSAGWESLTISSTAGAGLIDSTTPSQCQYNAPEGVVIATDGFAYVADTGNGVIRKMDETGVASTRVKKGVILRPSGITSRGESSQLYVSEALSNKIWKVVGTGAAWVAGSGEADFADGSGTAAAFNAPSQLAWASTASGEFVYIADRGNNRIRKLAVGTNTVTTLAGSGVSGYNEGTCALAAFNAPRGIAARSNGEVYVLDSGNNRIRKIL